MRPPVVPQEVEAALDPAVDLVRCVGLLLPRSGRLPHIGTNTSTIIATATTPVWISASVAVSSDAVPSQDSTIAGVITLECSPISRIDAPGKADMWNSRSNHAFVRMLAETTVR